MYNKLWATAMLFLASSVVAIAQEKRHLDLDEVIHLAASQSTHAKLLDAQTKISQLKVEEAKNAQLPESKLSGTYMLMNSPNIDLKIPMGSGDGPAISTNQLLLGQLSVNMPIYTGGKIKNGIKMAEDNWKSTELENNASKQKLSIQAVHLYLALYQAQQTQSLISENIKQAEQRVSDFKAMEQEGIIARNDLLKAELQLSNYRVSYKEAIKNLHVISYQLNSLLGLDEKTNIDNIDIHQLKAMASSELLENEERMEIKALKAKKEVANDQLKLSRANYHPILFASAGYSALQLHNLVTVTNAANVGLGISYDIGSLYKNKKKIKVDQQQVALIDEHIALENEKINLEIHDAQEGVQLAKEKNKLFQEALAQAKENYRITKDKYDNGVADTDDLLEADVQQLQSQINLAIGEATLIEKYYDLLLATGHFNIQ